MNKGILIDAGYEKTEKKTLLFIDSRDVTTTDPFEYTIMLNENGIDSYQNVTKITLKAITFPKILNESYFIFNIEESNDNVDSISHEAHRSSCIVFFEKGLSPGDFITRYPIEGNGREMIPNPPIKTLSRLRIRIRKHGGEIVAADIGNTMDNAKHTFLLEITEKI